jgi:hypothetical protein
MTRQATLLLTILTLLPLSISAESIRGPVAGSIEVSAVGNTEEIIFGMEELVIIDIADDLRFLDAIEIELTSPPAVAQVAGAVSLLLIAHAETSDGDGVIDVVGEELIQRPIRQAGKSFYQILLQSGANPDRSAATVRVSDIIDSTSLPIVLSVVTRMKGLAPDLYNSDFRVSVSPVTRDIGALQLEYLLEDGSELAPGLQSPGFSLRINGNRVDVSSEYLLPPGLHRIALQSDRYDDFEVTVGVERGRETLVRVPLTISLATVAYTAPREAVLYVNGELLPGSSGDFTVEPGEHTITMVMDDYTVTRRFVVEERKTYSLSLSMNIVIEEVN